MLLTGFPRLVGSLQVGEQHARKRSSKQDTPNPSTYPGHFKLLSLSSPAVILNHATYFDPQLKRGGGWEREESFEEEKKATAWDTHVGQQLVQIPVSHSFLLIFHKFLHVDIQAEVQAGEFLLHLPDVLQLLKRTLSACRSRPGQGCRAKVSQTGGGGEKRLTLLALPKRN